MFYFCVVTIFFLRFHLLRAAYVHVSSLQNHIIHGVLHFISNDWGFFYCDRFTQWTHGLSEHFSFCFAFLRKKVMCIYVHMSAASHYGSSFVYLFLACSWSFLFELVCACVCVKEDIAWVCTFYTVFSQPLQDCHMLGQSVTEDVLVNLDPHVCFSDTVLLSVLNLEIPFVVKIH